jgi:hypothetical protein
VMHGGKKVAGCEQSQREVEMMVWWRGGGCTARTALVARAAAGGSKKMVADKVCTRLPSGWLVGSSAGCSCCITSRRLSSSVPSIHA